MAHRMENEGVFEIYRTGGLVNIGISLEIKDDGEKQIPQFLE